MTTLQSRAVSKVHQAIKKGLLEKPTAFGCADCGKPAKVYDHRDYSKPLEVVPVCHSCNAKRPNAKGSPSAKPAGAKQSYEVTMALRWLKVAGRTVSAAAKRFKVHESTIWRAIGKQANGKRSQP